MKYVFLLIILLVSVSCQEENLPPSCKIVMPNNDFAFVKNEDIKFSVEAQDPDGQISEVQIYFDDLAIASLTTSPFEYVINTTEIRAGTHSLKAIAYDDKRPSAEDEVHLYIRALLPSISTDSSNTITENSMHVYGSIDDDGGAEVLSRGFYWGIDHSPEIYGEKVTSGSGTGAFSETITGLTPVRNYYVKAFAANSTGEAYGDEIRITTAGTDVFLDPRDGNRYEYLKIGEDVWMTENLMYLPDVTYPVDKSFDLSRHYVYDYSGNRAEAAKNTSNYETYGVLYNWPAAQGACPSGWHLPTDIDWKELEIHLGMSEAEANAMNARGTDQGLKLKASAGWIDGNGSNESKFSALPGGKLEYIEFVELEEKGWWWTRTEHPSNVNNSYIRSLTATDQVYRLEGSKENAYSIRCVRN
jgi:uncharacterized protein (TIGR02145 family)